MISCDYLIVGAGISGISAANILGAKKNKKVVIVEKRDHIGGNCYDCYNDDGLLIHLYGPHIFHTRHQDVWGYLSQFTEWLDYTHHVKAFVDGKFITFPININSFEQFFGESFSKEKVELYLENKKLHISEPSNAEEMVVSRMGTTLYEKFFKQYTKKQWGMDAKDLAPEITARIPIRLNRDDRFFSDEFQGMPKEGYTRMFENMLSHENIQLIKGTAYKEIINDLKYDTMIFTGPIDEFFDYRFGPLSYRGIHFDFKTFEEQRILPCAVVNYPNDFDYTRVTEFKQMTFQIHAKTCLCYEYPMDAMPGKKFIVPSYPVLNENSRKALLKYQKVSEELDNTLFMGRLGKFQYLNMDVCVKQVLEKFSGD